MVGKARIDELRSAVMEALNKEFRFCNRHIGALEQVRRLCSEAAANRGLLDPAALLGVIDKLLAEPASETNANQTGENDREHL